MTGHRSSEKEEYWKLVVAEWRESGLNIRKFCNGNGIRENSFYSWRRELEKRAKEQAGNLARENKAAQPEPSITNTPVFIPIKVKEEPTIAAPQALLEPIEIVSGKHTVRVKPGFDETTLRQVLAIVADSAEASA